MLLYLERLSVSCGGDMTLEPGKLQSTSCNSPARAAPYSFCLLGYPAIAHARQVLEKPLYRTYRLLAALLLHPGSQCREFPIGLLCPDPFERLVGA